MSSRRTNAASLASRLLLCCSLCATSAGAQIYGGVGDGGTVVLSNFRSMAARDIVVDDGISRPETKASPPIPNPRFASLIRQAARATDLSPDLLHAIISVESGFNARAVSPKGAKGLMQLMPATAAALGVTDPFDPRQNIAAGAVHLKSLLDRFGNNLELALAAYNAGADAVVKAGYQVPRYAETRDYVPRVISRLQVAQGETFPAGDACIEHQRCIHRH
jgi:hypothetical protein